MHSARSKASEKSLRPHEERMQRLRLRPSEKRRLGKVTSLGKDWQEQPCQDVSAAPAARET